MNQPAALGPSWTPRRAAPSTTVSMRGERALDEKGVVRRRWRGSRGSPRVTKSRASTRGAESQHRSVGLRSRGVRAEEVYRGAGPRFRGRAPGSPSADVGGQRSASRVRRRFASKPQIRREGTSTPRRRAPTPGGGDRWRSTVAPFRRPVAAHGLVHAQTRSMSA